MLRVPVFRIFYSTGFSLLLLFTLALLAVSPADVIFQSYRNRVRWGIVIVAGVYLLVVLVTLFIYATRLYATRIHLAGIPKSRLPLQKGDLPRKVRRLVLAGIERSASIAFRAKPRDVTNELRKRIEKAEGQEVPASGLTATWGELSHAGWAAPHDHETPNMHYAPVLQELPHLLEARAVSLAPVNASAAAAIMNLESNAVQLEEADQQPPKQSLPDPIAVALLQRLPSASLRSYIGQLIELDVLPDTDFAAEFLRLYETARFSGGPLHDRDFRVVMASFAQLLDTMQEPSIVALNRAAGLDDEASILTGRSGEQVEKQEHQAESDKDSEPSVNSRPKTKDTSRQQGIDRLAPPKLQLTRTRTRSNTSQSQGTADFSSSFATPGLISTPFYTPYIEPTSARTASTGSLAGSEGTSDSEADKLSKRSRSRKRNPSTFSYRSRLSQRTIGARNDSKNEHGLGLELKGDHVSNSATPTAAAAAATSKNDAEPKAEELAQSSSSDLDSSDASGNEADAMDVNEDKDEDEDSVRRLDMEENPSLNQADLQLSTSSTNSDSDRSAVRRRGHEAQPGRF